MALQFKEGVQLTVTKTINEILCAAEIVFMRYNVPVVVTSGTDGQHGEHSKHYTAEALDLRIFHLKPDDIQPIVKGLKELLGQNFDVVLERDHIHIEFDPKVKGELMALDPYFYDQLSQRLNKQDEVLDRIEQGQSSLLECMERTKQTQAAHIASDESNFYWVKWVLGGICTVILAIVTFLIKS